MTLMRTYPPPLPPPAVCLLCNFCLTIQHPTIITLYNKNITNFNIINSNELNDIYTFVVICLSLTNKQIS